MNKHKGSNAERELLHIFFENNWVASRIAGSGSTSELSCDLIAGKVGKGKFAIEAKSSKKAQIYISKEQIEDFILFSSILGLTPVIALRFNYEGWLFINPSQLEDSGKNWVANLKKVKEHGLKFSQFFETQAESISQ